MARCRATNIAFQPGQAWNFQPDPDQFNPAALLDLRIRLNSVDWGSWCAPLSGGFVDGASFIPYSDFNTDCGDNSGDAFDPATPISSVSFAVTGEPYGSAYWFCVDGFAAGDSAKNAPEYFF